MAASARRASLALPRRLHQRPLLRRTTATCALRAATELSRRIRSGMVITAMLARARLKAPSARLGVWTNTRGEMTTKETTNMKAFITAWIWKDEELEKRFGPVSGVIIELSDDTKTALLQLMPFGRFLVLSVPEKIEGQADLEIEFQNGWDA